MNPSQCLTSWSLNDIRKIGDEIVWMCKFRFNYYGNAMSKNPYDVNRAMYFITIYIKVRLTCYTNLYNNNWHNFYCYLLCIYDSKGISNYARNNTIINETWHGFLSIIVSNLSFLPLRHHTDMRSLNVTTS